MGLVRTDVTDSISIVGTLASFYQRHCVEAGAATDMELEIRLGTGHRN